MSDEWLQCFIGGCPTKSGGVESSFIAAAEIFFVCDFSFVTMPVYSADTLLTFVAPYIESKFRSSLLRSVMLIANLLAISGSVSGLVGMVIAPELLAGHDGSATLLFEAAFAFGTSICAAIIVANNR